MQDCREYGRMLLDTNRRGIIQGTLLLLSLTLLRRLADRLAPRGRQLLAAVLIGIGSAWTWSALVG